MWWTAWREMLITTYFLCRTLTFPSSNQRHMMDLYSIYVPNKFNSIIDIKNNSSNIFFPMNQCPHLRSPYVCFHRHIYSLKFFGHLYDKRRSAFIVQSRKIVKLKKIAKVYQPRTQSWRDREMRINDTSSPKKFHNTHKKQFQDTTNSPACITKKQKEKHFKTAPP